MLGFLQRIGRALMLPIAVLPAAGLILRFGQDDLLGIPFLAAAGNAIFGHLALIFAIGVAVGLAKDSNGAAGLAGAIGYFVLTEGAVKFAETNLGFEGKFDMSVLGGILAGVVAGLLYNKFSDIKLPDWLSFFGGKRFVPIVTAGTMVVLALVFGFIWPTIQGILEDVGTWITSAGAIGAGIFGFFNRLLIPLGLHHVLNSFLWFVFGEFTGENGKVVTGDLWRFFADDPKAGFYMAGFFPVMMFGLPAACFAMISTAKKHRKKAVAGMLGSMALTSFVTGITEPIEFAFMFLSPLLYVIHALLTAVSMSVAVLFDIHHGFTFSAGAIDYFLNIGKAQNGWLLLAIGAVYFVLYYAIFRYLIVKLDLKTPGREDEDTIVAEAAATGTAVNSKYDQAAGAYLAALGGKENIVQLDNCITRLRLQIKDFGKVDEGALKKAGSKGLIKLNNQNIQVVVGAEVEPIADRMREKL
ncbi:N-acetylglucosamine-specific PTS transporter subunit IIBC [Fictibacillus phosphorivorans]|uniref:N-acetylglucosamine-specific PTS transporter subunit IIBC n=1 Tax=Fictibacillus phosphorivorans TaxID=1221500 RepID=UPI00203C0FE1|nr:N-acetylglucosamine-specific PTS transporter subunit IIBC [Fictibacillus phosphorivorans]MCM3718694.1 N-acetylglucosamine-specific PTS transporter subunit IIBC [Fictibacillus phosphorivorans]MCM3776317.1 N-acetylglucosamine-specific PTS transporter subunit IIBC [Fictibacillus phosphorivorans]